MLPRRSIPQSGTITAEKASSSSFRQGGYLAWLATADLKLPGGADPLTDPGARDGAVRDYRTHLQIVARRKPATINTVPAAVRDFYIRTGQGAAVGRILSSRRRMRDRQWVPIAMLLLWFAICWGIDLVSGERASALEGVYAAVASVAVVGGVAYVRRRASQRSTAD